VDQLQAKDSALAELQALPQDAGTRHATIRRWSVVGNDRIMGSVSERSRPGDGKTIMTSPVVQVRLLGELRTPLAITQSGSAYWLADPAENFGLERATRFVAQKARAATPPEQPDPSLRTTVMKLV